jgi:hypothetical protein
VADEDDRIADRVAESAIRQRDEARAELRRLRERLESRLNAAEADAQHWEGKAATLAGAARAIVNDPRMPREQVQSRLLVAIQKYDQ